MNAWAMPQVDETRCTLCGLCVEACPCHAVTLGERGPIFSCPEECPMLGACPAGASGCSLCEEVCPTGAITCAFEIVGGSPPAQGHGVRALG
ncbi:MAG TPA: 4Fe-4S ferredoxin [Anaerolineae bacterium]|nr:4Fe-4S ferredoxin [Anaerolineae bacterium]